MPATDTLISDWENTICAVNSKLVVAVWRLVPDCIATKRYCPGINAAHGTTLPTVLPSGEPKAKVLVLDTPTNDSPLVERWSSQLFVKVAPLRFETESVMPRGPAIDVETKFVAPKMGVTKTEKAKRMADTIIFFIVV